MVAMMAVVRLLFVAGVGWCGGSEWSLKTQKLEVKVSEVEVVEIAEAIEAVECCRGCRECGGSLLIYPASDC